MKGGSHKRVRENMAEKCSWYGSHGIEGVVSLPYLRRDEGNIGGHKKRERY
jgi:hypothetical protein